MALPTHVQSSGWVLDVADVITISLTGVVTGNAILVGISQYSTTARTYTVTDAQGNTYTQRQRAVSSVVSEIWSAANVTTTAGAVTITITASGACSVGALAVEVGNIDTATPFDAANKLVDATNHTSHFSAPSTEIDTTTDVYCFAVAVLSGSSGGITTGTGWTTLTEGPAVPTYAQYRISASALTDERGPFTTVTSRGSVNCIASFKGAASGGIVGPLVGFRHLGGGGALLGGRLVS